MASSMLTAEVSGSAPKEADVDEALKSALHSCANDPDFAVVCDFLQKFSKDLGLDLPNFKLLLQWLTKTDEISPQLREMQIKLLRKTRKTVHEKCWESALSKFCFTYSAQDAWEVERFGYKNSSVKVKLRILRELLECQFERNTKFRAKILTHSADSLRSQPIGRDSLGHAYWVTQDNDCNIRIYQEHLDEEIWQVVATNRDEFVNLIKRLRGSEVVLPCTDIGVIDEDTTSSSSSSRTNADSEQKAQPPEVNNESQEDEQKVPILSIKLVHGKNSKEDVGKGEEELAAEEDAKQLKKLKNFTDANESGEEEFEEIEEEYEDESSSDGESEDDIDDDNKISKKNDNESDQKLENKSKAKDENKKVKPLLISQNKILKIENNSTPSNAGKKRALDQVDANSPPRNEGQQVSALKKSRPSLMDSKRSKSVNKYKNSNEDGEEDYDEDEEDLEEEIEEEDIDSVAAEEDENEEKQFEDYDDDEEDEVGEEINDPVVCVAGEGAGKDCDVENFLYVIDYDTSIYDDEECDIRDEIVEEVFYVSGEGYGRDCLVGNKNNDDDNTTNTTIKNNSEISKTKIEAKQESESEISLHQNENTTTCTVSPKNYVPKDDISIDAAKKAEDLIEKKQNSEENSQEKTENVNEIEKQIHPNEKNQINGENKSKELATKTQKENLSDPSENSDLPLSSGNIEEPDEKPHIETSSEDNQKPSTNLTISKTDSTLLDPTSQQSHASKMSALESLKKELRESKQKLLEKKLITTGESSNIKLASPATYNRKRRLTDQQQITNARPPNSESEIDMNSEDFPNDHELDVDDDDDVDVGGKRLKIRPKQTNTELRKKIEAQKVAVNDETTSSSGGEEELRRRKKIILSKQHAVPPLTINSEEIISNKESTNDDNAAKDNKTSAKIIDDPITATLTQPLIKKVTQTTPTKVKPTLAEIIEKKLKKTAEKNENDSTVSTEKNLFPSPNKIPITKPLKKNLLIQIRQEESDEEAVPRKRTNSKEINSQTSSDIKTMDITTKISEDTKSVVSKIDLEKQRTTPERQRKRRSSKETVQNDSPEEPEAKKEVTAAAKDNEVTVKRDKPADTINEEEITADSIDIAVKKESSIPVCGRRSGRRSGAAPAYVEALQTKRNRTSIKNAPKKEFSDCDKVEAKKEKTPSKGTKYIATNSKQDIKEKNNVDKLSNNKSKSCSKENVGEDIETKSFQTTTKVEIAKPKSSPTTTKTPTKGVRKQRDVDSTNIIDVDSETPVRQSRRIAQQKIREEAERRKLEEIALRTMKQELKKKKKAEKQADPTVMPPTEPSSESEESDVETKRKVQKKKCPGKDGNWSSGSEEQEEPDEEDEEPPHYETDHGSPLFKSDHEFSPESEIEDESQVVPMKRARTVRKEDSLDDANAADEEEEACQKCNKSDHPEWILLCDNCDKGYHCSCLSPVLFYIPEGDWYCPPCQQEQLIKALENQLKEFDNLVENKKKEEEQVKRLAEEEEKARQEKEEETKKHKNKNDRRMIAKRNNVNSSAEDQEENDYEESSTNSEDSRESKAKKQSTKNKNRNRSRNSKNSDKRNHRDRRHNSTRSRRSRFQNRGSDTDSDSQNSNKSNGESNSNFSSSSSTYSESDNEPIYKLRKRRQINVSYRLNEYDDLINSALKKEMDEAAGAGNLGRGKDISTIIEADKEKARQKHIDDGDEEIIVKPKEDEDVKATKAENCIKTEPNESTKEEKNKNVENDGDESDAEPIMRKFNIKPSQKKKSRKLTTLDISSEDDNASDEDFKGSSLEDDEEEDTSISASNSDSSLEIYKRHGKSKKKRRKAARRAFRERRKDRRFVVDESDDEEVQRPKSKKKRKDDSDYTESEADDDDISELSENIDSADLCDDTTTDESDDAWRPNKRKKAKKSALPFSQKSPKSKSSQIKKPKKVEYSDDDVSESEEDEDDDDENGNVGSGKGMGKQPRSQPLKTSSGSSKTKGKGKEKPQPKTKKKKKSSEDEGSVSDSEDSTRRTRGRRYAYIEDFDDDSSDGGIKPGVQRPDTPPEEREKFIKRQEEIKRMLAEKNAEGAKLVATPRLTPIKTEGEKDKRSPTKTAGGDSLSTVPLSVIRQAKVLDIDYLQRRGENLDELSNDMGEVDDDFDDADLPDDLPEDMDEDAIARMVEEEEDFGGGSARDLPAPDEVLRTTTIVKTPKIKEVEKPILPAIATSSFPSNSPQVNPVALPTPTASGLQEPVRKRLPMPTMHPPLLRHQQYLMHESMSNTHHLMQRHGGPPPTSHLLQSALSAPLTQPLDRNYHPTTPSPSHHSLINRMVHNIPLQPTHVSQALGITRPSQSLPPPPSVLTKSSPLIGHPTQDKSTNSQPIAENKPRGRRKKITPLRDTLQKQQTAAAVTAATATNAALASAIVKNSESVGSGISSQASSVIKSGSAAKLPMQASVITSMPPTSHTVTNRPGMTMPPISGAYVRADSSRFYDLPGNRISQIGVQRHRGPPQMPPSLLPPHPANRPSYGPPPPLKGSSSGSSALPSSSPSSVRSPMHHVPQPYLGMPPNARHVSSHLNMYSRPPMYGNPNFGSRVNLRPPNIHAPEYSSGSRAYPPYGFYPPPPPLTTPPGQRSGLGSAPRPSTQIPPVSSALTQPPASVIVSAAAAKSSNALTATPPPTPDINDLSSSSKPVLVANDLAIKVSPPKTSSPTRVVPQTEKPIITAVPLAEPRKKLTTLQAYTASTAKKSPVRPTGDSSGSQSSPGPSTEVNDDSSPPGHSDNTPAAEQPTRQEGQASEFSGLVSYFSSQHDDYNT